MNRALPGEMKPTRRALSRLRRACFGAAAVLVATAVVVPVVARAAPTDPDADRPIVWAGSASASPIHGQADSKNGVLPVYQPFYANLPDSATTWDPGAAYARASTYYPGATGVNGLNLICDQVFNQVFTPGRLPPNADDPICKPAPKYPLTVEADGVHPDVRTDGSQAVGTGSPLVITTTSAIAHADRSSVYGDGVIGSVDLVGTSTMGSASLAFRKQAAAILHGPAAAAGVRPQASDNSSLHIDSAVAHTKQIYDSQGALVVTATSTLKGISLAGGLVQIGTLNATSTSRTDGKSIATHNEHITLEGVSVQGQPAAIDETGVHVGSTSNSAKPLTDALNSALAAMGARIALASATGAVDTSSTKTVTSNVEGLTFYIERLLPIPNLTDVYYATFTLGVAGTRASAANITNSELANDQGGIGGVTGPSPDQSSSALPSDSTPASFSSDAAPPTPGSSFSNTTTGRTGRPSVLGNRRGLLGQLEGDLAGFSISHRFDLLYLAFALAFVGVCLSSRLLVPRARRIT
jgi:hypothetical protein